MRKFESIVENIAGNVEEGYIQTGLKKKSYALSVIKILH
jgi:hypothetical protein